MSESHDEPVWVFWNGKWYEPCGEQEADTWLKENLAVRIVIDLREEWAHRIQDGQRTKFRTKLNGRRAADHLLKFSESSTCIPFKSSSLPVRAADFLQDLESRETGSRRDSDAVFRIDYTGSSDGHLYAHTESFAIFTTAKAAEKTYSVVLPNELNLPRLFESVVKITPVKLSALPSEYNPRQLRVKFRLTTKRDLHELRIGLFIGSDYYGEHQGPWFSPTRTLPGDEPHEAEATFDNKHYAGEVDIPWTPPRVVRLVGLHPPVTTPAR